MCSSIITRILVSNQNIMQEQEQQMESLSDMVFGYFEGNDYNQVMSRSCYEKKNDELDDIIDHEEDHDQEKESNNGNVDQENNNFWETQHQILQGTLCRSSSLESRIRNATKEALKEIQMAATVCACGKPMEAGGSSSCKNCLMREVSGRLGNAGYNTAICKTKWRSSPNIPSGEHTFMDLVDNSSTKKGEVRVIIELNFRAEFEMARASEEYNRLVHRLPEVFVGKVERLTNVIKILCTAAKRCMKEKRMHLGPWRKQRYMQAKWLSTCKRTTAQQLLPMGFTSRLPKPRASMLTVDLLEKLPNMNCTAVEVV